MISSDIDNVGIVSYRIGTLDLAFLLYKYHTLNNYVSKIENFIWQCDIALDVY